MPYSRDAFIHHLTNYYRFCHRVFWEPDETICHAPRDGWPTITHDTLRNLRITDTALDLLRHLPYPHWNDDPRCATDIPYFMPETRIIDYRSASVHAHIRSLNDDNVDMSYLLPYERPPPSFVGIAMSPSRNGFWVLLNTDDGLIYWGGPSEETPGGATALNDSMPEDHFANREGYSLYEPEDFFEACKDRFRRMEWVSVGGENFEWTGPHEPSEWPFEYIAPDGSVGYPGEGSMDYGVYKVACLMVRAGWPGDGEGGGWDREYFWRLMCGEEEEEEEREAEAERPLDLGDMGRELPLSPRL